MARLWRTRAQVEAARTRSASVLCLAVSFGLLCSLIFGVGQADALSHPFVGTFGSSAQPEFGEASGLAVDQSNGDLLVIDLADQTLSRYDATGNPAPFSALGSNVIDGSSGEDATPQGRILSVEVPGAAIEAEAAVAPTSAAGGSAGHIYVTDAFDYALDVFDSTGKYLTQLSAGYACGVAVDSTGRVYVGDWEGSIHVYEPTGPTAFSNVANWGAAQTGVEHPCILAAGAQPTSAGGSDGSIFAINWFSGAQQVTKVNAVTGQEQYVVDSLGENVGLSVDPGTGHLYVAGGSHITEYDVSGASSPKTSSVIALSSTARGVAVRETVGVTGGTVYVSREGASHVEVWGPAEPQPPKVEEPSVSLVGQTETTVAAQVNPEGAPLSFHVEYVDQKSFETEGGFASPHTQTTPEVDTGFADSAFHTVEATLSGLVPHTTYRWRIVATNSCSGPCGTTAGPDAAFTTSAVEAPIGGCPNDALRSGAGRFLSDCRAFEMVSPPEKNSAEVAVPTPAGGLLGETLIKSVIPLQAAPSGEAISYASGTAFGEAESAPLASQYESDREPAGWSTRNIDPKFEEGSFRDPVVGFSSDLEHAAVIAIEPKLTPDATEGFPNLYRRDADGSLTALTTEDHAPELGPTEKARYCLSYGGASSDFDHVFFAANGALNPGDPTGLEAFNLYEWHQAGGGGIRLVSVLPDGSAAEPNFHTGFGYSLSNGEAIQCKVREALLRHAVSVDGSRVFWTYSHELFEIGPGKFARRPLLARIDGSETVQLDAVQGGPAVNGGEGHFWDATPDGSKVFFTDPLLLTPGQSHPNDLYVYDFAKPPGSRLTDLTAQAGEAASVLGVTGVSEDGNYVYFVAKGVLLGSGEGPTSEEAHAGQPNLYVWHEGSTKFVTTLDESDRQVWSEFPTLQEGRIAPDGRHLAFVSRKSLTDYDNRISGSPACAVDAGGNPSGGQGCTEAFVYDFATATLSCASCNPSGARPQGPPGPRGETSVPTWGTPYEQARYLSDDGTRVFFQSLDSLVSRDTNRKQDVYEWEAPGAGTCSESSDSFSSSNGGCVTVVSAGDSSDLSYLLDASSSGDDVFISTRSQLFAADQDERYDVYDARVGGGFVPPMPPNACLSTDECRSTSGRNGEGQPSLATNSYEGRGNPVHRHRCRRGRRRVHRAGRVRCIRAKHHHRVHRRGKHHRHTDNSNRRNSR
jgi:hypothetical protein